LFDEDEMHFVWFVATNPIFYEDAVKSANWRIVMDVEMEAIEKNGTWELMELPNGAKMVGVK